jgi:hypothetical protein
MANAIGNKFFTAQNVQSGVETTIFNYKFSGTNNSFQGITALRCYSPTGCPDFVLRLYMNGQQIDGDRLDLESESSRIAIDDLGYIRLQNGATLTGTAFHFDQSQTHDFETTLVGGGIA